MHHPSPRALRATLPTLAAALLALAACSDQRSSAPPPGAVDPNSAQFKQAMQARLDEMKKEELVREQAPWFGKTGLPDEQERELPRYLRRELGMLLAQPGSLKAADLDYLGVFVQGGETVHYWRMRTSMPEPAYAYVVTAPPERQVMAWGDRKPPQ